MPESIDGCYCCQIAPCPFSLFGARLTGQDQLLHAAPDDRLDSDPIHDEAPPCCCLSPSPLNRKPCLSSVVVSPYLLKCVSESPMMSHLYLSSAYVNSFSFPHWFKVRTFHVPMIPFSVGKLHAPPSVSSLRQLPVPMLCRFPV